MYTVRRTVYAHQRNSACAPFTKVAATKTSAPVSSKEATIVEFIELTQTHDVDNDVIPTFSPSSAVHIISAPTTIMLLKYFLTYNKTIFGHFFEIFL